LSHVSRIELEINSLEDLKQACKRLALKFMENQKIYRWYGRYVGDAPLPEGITVDDLGKCDHAIKVPGAIYEIGIVHKDNKYILLWDTWHAGKLEEKLVKNAGLLKQAYAIERVRKEAKRKTYRLQEKQIPNGIRLVLNF
jgi:hypothetical protein